MTTIVASPTPTCVPVVESILHILEQAANLPQFPEGLEAFYLDNPPPISLMGYLERLHTFLPCTEEEFIISAILLARIEKEFSVNVLTAWTCHKLILASIVVSIKMHNDTMCLQNSWAAQVGGITTEEMNFLERAFLSLLSFHTHIHLEEYYQWAYSPKQPALHLGRVTFLSCIPAASMGPAVLPLESSEGFIRRSSI